MSKVRANAFLMSVWISSSAISFAMLNSFNFDPFAASQEEHIASISVKVEPGVPKRRKQDVQ